jgi:hypothetical protein
MSKRLPPPAQLGFVVPSVNEAAKVWWEKYGVGPWRIWNFGPDSIDDQLIDGEPAEYSMRLAIALWGELEIELLEPLDDRSIYAKSLAEHGGKAHLHHFLTRPEEYDAAIEDFAGRGIGSMMSGAIAAGKYSYFDTENEIGTIVELGYLPDAVEHLKIPAKEEVYPPRA